MTYEESQPSYFVDGPEPPMLLLYGREDKKIHISNINKMRTVIEENGGKVDAIMYADVDHSEIVGALSIPLRDRYEILSDISNFLNIVVPL